MLADYKVSLRGKAGEDRAAALEGCHERGAHRLMKLCFANGGIYIKLGQHIGQLVGGSRGGSVGVGWLDVV